jgi:ectoine hydroxylase-related dioxygenase (phytanoyl-CoA dioxygenase family)
MSTPPQARYGVLRQDRFSTPVQEVADQVRRLGYAVLDGGYENSELQQIITEFERTWERYVAQWGESALAAIDELHTIRAPICHGGESFRQLAFNAPLLALVRELIEGKFILNQQNGVINPPRQSYNQGAWHRDLPYQHFVSSSPLAINALFCLDDFTLDNGATFVLPASHKVAAFPSDVYVEQQALQIQAKAGQYVVLDCMLFHCGGFNRTEKARRAVNHVFTIPYLKQQINLPVNIAQQGLTADQLEILGFNYQEHDSIAEYFAARTKL